MLKDVQIVEIYAIQFSDILLELQLLKHRLAFCKLKIVVRIRMNRKWKCEECGKIIGKRWSFFYCYSCAMIKAGYTYLNITNEWVKTRSGKYDGVKA